MTKSFQKILSKSKYLNGIQCPKLLWISVNDKTMFPEVDEAQQKLFDEGHIVGEFAKKLFPGGIDIEDEDFAKNLEETKKLVSERKILFEPAFLVDRLYSRADILEPLKDGSWNIIEVKSSTEVKDVNIQDVAFQKYVYEKAGLRINKCYLMHINNQYVRQGDLELDKLFTKEDISINVQEEIQSVPERVTNFLRIIDGKEPSVTIGEYCDDPYECPMKKDCWAFLPKENSVFDLYRGGQKSWGLFEQNILAIKDIPATFKLNDKQQIQLKCEKTGEIHLNKKPIEEFLKNLKYPLYFLDFETYQTAIPLYNGLKPYQQIPFQFSVHKITKAPALHSSHSHESSSAGGKTHFSFIASGKQDPRKKFVNAIKRKLGTKGSVIVYNQAFEQSRLKELAELFPLDRDYLLSVNERMVDLLVPFRNFDYYNRKQEGSASIKYVLPAMTDLTYKGMEIANGGQASMKYAYITHGGVDGKKASKEEIKKVREDLKKYCALDTEAMIRVMDGLKGVVNNP